MVERVRGTGSGGVVRQDVVESPDRSTEIFVRKEYLSVSGIRSKSVESL